VLCSVYIIDSAMGNILSFFFPQPEPPCIDQVEEVVEEKIEETIAEELKDTVAAEHTKSADLVVENDIEPIDLVHTDEGFEVVEGAALSKIRNTQHHKVTDSEPKSNANGNENLVAPFADERELEGPCCDLTLEPNIDEVEIKMVENALRVESSSPYMYGLSSNSPPPGVEEIGSIQDDNIKLEEEERIKEPETVSTSEAPVADEPEPFIRSKVESTMVIPDPIRPPSPKLPVKLQEDIADEEIIEEPEVCVCFGRESEKSVSPEFVKGQTPEPTEKMVKVSSPEVEVFGSILDGKPKEVPMNSSFTPKSSFCGTMMQSTEMNYELKEDIIVKAAESPEVQLLKDVSRGVEELKNIQTVSNILDYEVKEDSPVTEVPVKADRPVELPNEVLGGVEELKNLTTESSKVEE